ncbi:M23 family metallopeptidase [Thalassospira lucentensis]|uniref:M23 family metallopeptidase n=1 Tax=Thalassospira lucentensis TaxID=168935 RepID=UPI00142DECD3|nr:M23 family metallopeptidase [Thalassospira lucentensis]NIZ02616.1 M23 family metallopeptidase [Thalassospira lucentensis]
MAGRDLVSIVTVLAILGGTAGYLLSDHYSTADDTALSASAAESLPENVTETASIPVQPARRETVVLEQGSNLMAALTSTGVERNTAYSAIEALRDVYNPRKLRAGQKFELVYSADAQDSDDLLDVLSFQPDPETIVSVSRTDDGFDAATDKVELTPAENAASGTIQQSLFLAAENNGVPVPVLMEMIELYSYEVDFQRDIQPGDSFEVMYEQLNNDAGERVRYGDILYASMTLSGNEVRLYSYTDSNGDTDFYNQKGESYRRALMRTPINGARLSSGYGARRHPVLGYTKMHKGVDFAAPPGTPIFAAGNGTIARIGPFSSYGNYIRIRHNDSYSTAYAHMRGFAKGLHQGSRVKQGDVIGYVGATGRVTGPHLHYEILKDNVQVNPIKVRMPSGKKLKDKELERFIASANMRRKQYAELSLKNRKIASAD